MTPTNVLLSGVVGSVAYGLATPDSDLDILGIFAVPTAQLHGLRQPQQTYTATGPDYTYHEVTKAVRLMMGGNPTVLELLYLDNYPHENASRC
jgi:predicted nucleotidyltransferase